MKEERRKKKDERRKKKDESRKSNESRKLFLGAGSCFPLQSFTKGISLRCAPGYPFCKRISAAIRAMAPV